MKFIAVVLCLLFVPLMGCISRVDTFQQPGVGSIVDPNDVVTIQEKWRVYEGDCIQARFILFSGQDCGMSYHAKLTNGFEIPVNASIYDSLPVNRTCIARGPPAWPIGITSIETFFPVNITSYSDVRNMAVVVP